MFKVTRSVLRVAPCYINSLLAVACIVDTCICLALLQHLSCQLPSQNSVAEKALPADSFQATSRQSWVINLIFVIPLMLLQVINCLYCNVFKHSLHERCSLAKVHCLNNELFWVTYLHCDAIVRVVIMRTYPL